MEQSSAQDDFVKKFSASKFNYWAGYAANLSLVAWLLSRAFQGTQSLLNGQQWIVCVLAGLALWTLAEYVFHRYLYHEISSLLSVGHRLHHEDPQALIGVPWYLTAVLLIGVYYGFAAFLNPAKTGVVMALTWLGYIGYCYIHHSMHHFNFRNAYFVKMRKHHLIHHAKDDLNWGISTRFWDVVFGTLKR